MDKLRIYLNSLTPEQQSSFATSVETSIGYLRKAISGGQLLNPATCVKIENNSNLAVTRKDLRPDDWQDIWPEFSEERIANEIERRRSPGRRSTDLKMGRRKRASLDSK
jgi:DNA-binding transcriptional regulator YdaS (Cro superfamily)